MRQASQPQRSGYLNCHRQKSRRRPSTSGIAQNIDFRRKFQILTLARGTRVLAYHFSDQRSRLAHPGQRNLFSLPLEQSFNAARFKPADEFQSARVKTLVKKFFWARLGVSSSLAAGHGPNCRDASHPFSAASTTVAAPLRR